MAQGCVMTLANVISQRSRSQCKHALNLCLNLLASKFDLDNISNNFCPWSKGVSWLWPKVISLRSRSQWTHTQNPCPGNNSLLSSWILIVIHTIVIHDPRVCHNLEPRSYLSSRSQCTHNQNQRLCHKLYLVSNVLNCCPWSKFVSWPWTKVICARSR